MSAALCVVLAVVAAVGLFGLLLFARRSADIGRPFFGEAVCRSGRGLPLLSFDDGPDADITPRVLEVLQRHNAQAIFFVVGTKARRHPELLRRMLSEGHLIGNHTMHHNPFANFLGAERLRREIEECSAVVERATGLRPTLFRPPLGIRTHFTHAVCRELGMTVVGWSVRSLDTVSGSPEETISRVLPQLEPDSLLLLHDRVAGAERVAEAVLGARD